MNGIIRSFEIPDSGVIKWYIVYNKNPSEEEIKNKVNHLFNISPGCSRNTRNPSVNATITVITAVIILVKLKGSIYYFRTNIIYNIFLKYLED
jgi:hypothetical protein